MKHDFEIDGHAIKWSYIKQFYKCDSKLSIRLAPKITEKHLDLPPFAAMRVSLAAQVRCLPMWLSENCQRKLCTQLSLLS